MNILRGGKKPVKIYKKIFSFSWVLIDLVASEIVILSVRLTFDKAACADEEVIKEGKTDGSEGGREGWRGEFPLD